jgi:myo-inositol 2-dehydrogenase / D-chiro-inositol 1-dehydrogenase
MEKPVAVDGPGVRQVLAAAAEAKGKNLKVGVGLQRHHDPGYLETIKRIHDGAIGEVVALRVYWNDAGVWVRPRKPARPRWSTRCATGTTSTGSAATTSSSSTSTTSTSATG